MLEGKALVIAIMMLTAAPIAATDSGQIFIEDVRDNFEDMLANDEPTKVSEIIDDSKLDEKDHLATKDSDIPCFTFEEWKDQYTPEEKIDDERDESEENDRARGDSKDDEKTDDKKEEYYDREDWADKETVSSSKYDGCLTDDEWTLKFESDEDKEEPCFTIEDLEKKMGDERKSHKNFFGRDKEWDREEKDWDDEWFEELEILAEACKEGDEESCDELLAIREEWANDDESEDETEEEESEQDDDRDEDEDFRLYLEELSNACDEGDEEACGELREIMAELAEDREENDWDRKEKDWDDKACLTKEEWKEVFSGKDRKDGYEDDDGKERGPHRDAFVREMLEELEYACEEENNEEACAELEEIVAEFEEREGECNKERDDDESDEEDNHEDEDDESDGNDEDESNEE